MEKNEPLDIKQVFKVYKPVYDSLIYGDRSMLVKRLKTHIPHADITWRRYLTDLNYIQESKQEFYINLIVKTLIELFAENSKKYNSAIEKLKKISVNN
jgi:hypothetical protein